MALIDGMGNELTVHQVEDLKLYCAKQHQALTAASDHIKKLEAENKHLKELLEHYVDRDKAKMVVSVEQEICEIELKRLKDLALERDLSLEETKRLDLLVKNLRLSKGQSTTLLGQARKVNENVTDAELISLVSK